MTTTPVHPDEHLDEALLALRSAVTEPAHDRERWRERVRGALNDVEDALRQHTLDAESSYDRALERSLGRVRAEIDRLTRDHVRLWSQVHFLAEEVDGGATDLRDSVDTLQTIVADHRLRVSQLSHLHRQPLE
jgi:hypothetical protein